MKQTLFFTFIHRSRRFFPLLTLMLVLLSGCALWQPVDTSVGPVPNQDAAPGTPTSVLAAQQPTAYPIDTDQPVPTLDPCVYPVEGVECPEVLAPEVAYPAPDDAAGLLSQPTPAAPAAAAAAFQDCARTPGLSACDAQSPAASGHLAFYEAASARLIFLDLASGSGAQVELDNPPRALDWSEDGQSLLVDLGADWYALYSASGEQQEVFQSEVPPRWQPGGVLSRDGVVRSADGWQADLRSEDGLAWNLHLISPQGDETLVPLVGPSPDTLFSLRGWVPGQPVLLLQMYTAGNAAMLVGGQLALFDAQAGALTPLDAYAPLDDAAFDWSAPDGTSARMAFLTGGSPEGSRGLAIYDFVSADLRYPLPEGVIVNDLAWRPDGERLAFSVFGLAESASEAARTAFPNPGIYLLDPQSGEVEPLVQSPPGALDGWPRWTAAETGGDILLYARALPGRAGAGAVQARALQVDTGQEWVLVDGLPVDETVAGQVVWRRLLAFTPQ